MTVGCSITGATTVTVALATNMPSLLQKSACFTVVHTPSGKPGISLILGFFFQGLEFLEKPRFFFYRNLKKS